jgi:hypothetical protein
LTILKLWINFSSLHVCYIPRPSHRPLYNHFNHIWCSILIMTPHFTQIFFPISNFHYQ